MDANGLVDGEIARAAGERSARLTDCTDLQREQERFLESERMAAIETAMNGLAHESRNALQRAQACLEMLTREVQDRPAALDLISRIQAAQNELHLLYEKVRDYASPLRLDLQRHSISS